jgi:hypothetical protein
VVQGVHEGESPAELVVEVAEPAGDLRSGDRRAADLEVLFATLASGEQARGDGARLARRVAEASGVAAVAAGGVATTTTFLIVRDRLFGTLEPEGNPVVYGLTNNIHLQPGPDRHARASSAAPRRGALHQLSGAAEPCAARSGWSETHRQLPAALPRAEAVAG